MGTTDYRLWRFIASFAKFGKFWAVLWIVFTLDHITKALIIHVSGFPLGVYPPHGGLVVIEGFFNLVYAVNYGAAWGILQGFAYLLIGLAIVVLVFIYIFRRDLLLQQRHGQWVFGLICGGILGNTVDRLFRGHVVDFLDFTLPFYRWPTFNIADAAIVCGTIWYLFSQFRSN